VTRQRFSSASRDRGPAAGRAVAPLLLAAAWLLLPFALAAEDMQVDKSQGAAEALIPGLGWRRAVLGRALPEESVVTTWLDAGVTIARAGLSLDLPPLTHLTVVSGAADNPVLSLDAGSVTVRCERPLSIRVPTRGVEISGQGTFTLTTATLSVTVGELTVRSGAQAPPVTVRAGGSLSLLPRVLTPVFSRGPYPRSAPTK
jgi:hypothetical protein